MSCVYFPIVLTYKSAYSSIILIDFNDMRWMTSQWPTICDQQSLFCCQSPPAFAQTQPTLTPILSTRWYSSSIIILHPRIRLMSSTATNLHLTACPWPNMMWTYRSDHISPDMGPRWEWRKQMTDGITYENNTYEIYKRLKKYVNVRRSANSSEVNQKELKWNEKSASFYIIMYFFTYNLKYESLPLGGSDLNFFI